MLPVYSELCGTLTKQSASFEIGAAMSSQFSEEKPAAQSKMLVQGHAVQEWSNHPLSPKDLTPDADFFARQTLGLNSQVGLEKFHSL